MRFARITDAMRFTILRTMTDFTAALIGRHHGNASERQLEGYCS